MMCIRYLHTHTRTHAVRLRLLTLIIIYSSNAVYKILCYNNIKILSSVARFRRIFDRATPRFQRVALQLAAYIILLRTIIDNIIHSYVYYILLILFIENRLATAYIDTRYGRFGSVNNEKIPDECNKLHTSKLVA